MKEINGKNLKLYINKNKLNIEFREKFIFRRGRINCSLNDAGRLGDGLEFSFLFKQN